MLFIALVVSLLAHSSQGASCDPRSTVADIVFVIKNSVGGNFMYLTDFVENIASQFTISNSKVQIGAVTYDVDARRFFNLNSFTNAENMKKAMQLSRYDYAEAALPSRGFEYVTTRMFRGSAGARGSTPRIVVHIGSNDLNQVIAVSKARELESTLGATLIDVGVSSAMWPSMPDYNALVSYPENAISADSLFKLKDDVDKVVQRICEVPKLSKSPRPAPVIHDTPCNPLTDVVFVFDSSGSLSQDMDRMKAFGAHVSEDFVLGRNAIQVGAMYYGTLPYKGFDLKDHTTYSGIKKAFESIGRRFSEKTHTSKALAYAENTMFQTKGGARLQAKKVLVLVSDGHSAAPAYTMDAGTQLKAAGIQIVTVQIQGQNWGDTEMKGLASSTNYFFNRNTAFDLYTAEYPVFELICSGSRTNPSTAAPVTRGPTTTPRPNIPKPGNCAPFADIVFALDASGSVGSHWVDEINFAKSISQKFVLGRDDVQIAAISFGSYAEKGFYLNKYTDQRSLANGFSSVTNLGRSTATYKGFDLIRTDIFQRSAGARHDADKFVILITDGESNDQQLTVAAARKLKDNNVYIIVVGIGQVNESELKAVATSHQDVFLTTNFASLSGIVESVYRDTCSHCSQ